MFVICNFPGKPVLFGSGLSGLWDLKKISKDELITFEKKIAEVKKLENVEHVQGFIFSRSGFTTEAEEYCQERGIACSEDERWLETGKLK